MKKGNLIALAVLALSAGNVEEFESLMHKQAVQDCTAMFGEYEQVCDEE